MLLPAGCRLDHLDVMDGHFVPNYLVSAQMSSVTAPAYGCLFSTAIFLIAPAEPYLEAFAKAGCDCISVHVRQSPHLHRSLQTIAGLARKSA